MIRDRIVFGVASAKIRGKLINEGKDFTLDKAIEIDESFEYSQEQLKSMENGPTEFHVIHTRRRPYLEPHLEPVVTNVLRNIKICVKRKSWGHCRNIIQKTIVKAANGRGMDCGKPHGVMQLCFAINGIDLENSSILC